MNVLLIGSGGREHALAWKLRQSARLGDLWLGDALNPGLAMLGKPVDVPVDPRAPFQIQRFCDTHAIGLVVIGPEEPLAGGLADVLAAPNRAVFGPTADGARLESDKAWSKEFMRAASIPTAEGRAFTDPEAAKAFVRSRPEPWVIKASGLAKGKGVVVPSTIDEGIAAIDAMMTRRSVGEAGTKIVVEERLKGREVSVFALVDGKSIYVLETCRDHKRLGDGGAGPNTGGMGATCPVLGADGKRIVDGHTLSRIEREILLPTVDALRRESIDYRGVLYLGLMLTHAGPKVIEYNVRFGDPECQVLMARLKSDLLDILLATGSRRLEEVNIEWAEGDDGAAAVCVVLAGKGYPGASSQGLPIEGLDRAAALEGVRVFHAGTRRGPNGGAVTHGGRVINIVGVGASVDDARRRAYRAVEQVHFDGKTYRTDIGTDVVG
ncbi:MAG: phosphoribosylamine--glycine ligase [Phycisphaerae bacterium]|nr:phosphoribosylamine--glycine ligase [Phycisphaerae bacterium]